MRPDSPGRVDDKAAEKRVRTLGVALLSAAFLVALSAHRLTAQTTAVTPYWQQDVRYTISAALDEPSGVLVGAGRLVYRNNSPDTLGDLYFHLYLNAFRPGSLWSADEQREGIHRFADLPEPYNAFEDLRRVRLGAVDLAIDYPHAPDSTIAHVSLPRPLLPRDSLVVQLEWRARPSVIPRRQGRRGRRFDFAQWYPKVSVYDRHGWQAHPLHLAGELYGEYGSYDVTLDLAEDQVVAATALPVGGDPGWARARATPDTPVSLQSDWYGARLPAAAVSISGAAPGRKRVRFYAEHIHHFAFSLNPEYRYEEGRLGAIVLRTFYLPQDSVTWGGGRVIERTRRAMAWLDSIYGPYPYPQTVVLHRIEGGGTEFPMLVMNGGPEESLIFHEVGHIYTYGILGNNEWKEGWLDEGFTTFQTAWNFQRRGMGVPSIQTQQLILNMDLDGWSEPIATPGEDFSEFGIYNRMIYTKGQLFYEMLRYVVGEDTFRRGLRLYYDRWKLKHVDEDAFRLAMEEVSGQDLRTFFAEWLHRRPVVDYGVGRVRRSRLLAGGWRTEIEVRRYGDGVMPVDIAVPAGDTIYTVRATGVRRVEVVTITTPVRPGRVELDPARQTMDWNYLNNVETPRLLFFGGSGGPRPVTRFGWSGSQPARRDRLVNNIMPLAWYSDEGGVTLGVQQRSNYQGRYQQNVGLLAYATRRNVGSGLNYLVALRNPVATMMPRVRWGLEGFSVDGFGGARGWATLDRSPHLNFGPRVTLGFDVGLVDVTRPSYVDPLRWETLYVGEAGSHLSSRWTGEGRSTELRVAVGGGLAGISRHLASGGTRTYVRATTEARHRRRVGPVELAARLFAGGAAGFSNTGTPLFDPAGAPRQRLLYLAGADPYETLMNPFLRSRGALFVRPGVHYTAPGGGGLRGLNPDLATDWLAAVNLEIVRQVFSRPRRHAFTGLSLAAFVDGATTGGDTLLGLAPRHLVADAGVGLRATHRIGPTRFVTRFDVPFLVTPAGAAVGALPPDGRAKFRFVWSLEEAF